MTNPKARWRRAVAFAKDKCSLYLATLSAPRRGFRHPAIEAAVIRATTHDDRSVDYKNAGRVFAWARTSSSFHSPLMWALTRRTTRTRSWPVALKSLLLAHGLLLVSTAADDDVRLPFDLSSFRDRSSDPSSSGFTAFVRAYFHFLDHRSFLLSARGCDEIDRIAKLQALLDLLIQIRPYGDGMEVALVLEAMDCVVIEIFEVYGGICSGIASFLVGVHRWSSVRPRSTAEEEERRRIGTKGIRVLRKAADQSTHLSDYFNVCRSLGVLNATEFPPVERIPEEDIRDLEKLLIGGISGRGGGVEREEEKNCGATVVTENWVVFEDEFGGEGKKQGHFGNSSVCAIGDRPCAAVPFWNGNLIEL